MDARRRSTITLLIVAIAIFIIRWPLDNHICDPKTWGEFRPSPEVGETTMKIAFQGSGTPAVYAMLGGQRDLVANILWTYSDVLFHEGKPFEMVQPLEATVTLSPSFLEAWSVYGWHLAWNLNTYVGQDPVLKAKYLFDGEQVYLRGLFSNADKPRPYFDLAWLYIQRVGNFEKAKSYLEAVVNNTGFIVVDGVKRQVPQTFQPYTQREIKAFKDGTQVENEVIERKWLPSVLGNRLGYVYKELGIMHNDPTYFDKAIAVYKRCAELDPNDAAAKMNATDLTKHRDDLAWRAKQLKDLEKRRDTYGMSPSSQIYGSDEHTTHNH